MGGAALTSDLACSVPARNADEENDIQPEQPREQGVLPPLAIPALSCTTCCGAASKGGTQTTIEDNLPEVSNAPFEDTQNTSREEDTDGVAEVDFNSAGPDSTSLLTLTELVSKCKDVEWLNFSLARFWPQARALIIRRGTEMFIDAVTVAAVDIPEISVDDMNLVFDPGSVPPRISNVQPGSRSLNGIDGLQVDADLTWEAGPEFCVKPELKLHGPAGVKIEISGITVMGASVTGTVSCMFAPLIDSEPLFGNLQIFFIDLPSLDIDIDNNMHLPDFLRSKTVSLLKKAFVHVLTESFVLPNRAIMRTRPDVPLETLVEVKSPLPLGVLEIEVLQASNLLASDTHFTGKPTSDPFVEIRVGNGFLRTSTVLRTVSPKWHDGPDYLWVYDMAQQVRIDVFDDDVWTEDDSLGYVQGYNVHRLCKEFETSPDGVWLTIEHPEASQGQAETAGKLRIRGRFLAVQPLKPALSLQDKRRPVLVTVKLLGMEGSKAAHMSGAKATVEWFSDGHVPGKGTNGKTAHSTETMDTIPKMPKSKSEPLLRRAQELVSRTWMRGKGLAGRTAEKIKNVTGIGYGHRVEGIAKAKASSSAYLWQSDVSHSMNSLMKVEPSVVRVIEHLRHREAWNVDRISDIVGLDEVAVSTVAAMRGNFEIVWGEAFHFMCPPDHSPFDGSLRITIRMPPRVRKFRSNFGGLFNSSGLVGNVVLHLRHEPVSPDTDTQRRVRARVRREGARRSDVTADEQEALAEHENMRGDHQCDASTGDVIEGILVEFVVEMRPMESDDVDKYLKDGQGGTASHDRTRRSSTKINKVFRAHSEHHKEDRRRRAQQSMVTVSKEASVKRKKSQPQRADETVDYANTLTITVDRSKELKLGLHAYNNEGEDFMRIRSIMEDGLIGEWNASHEGVDEQLVKIGYHIVGVNGKKLPNEMKSEIVDVSITKVVLTLRRAVPNDCVPRSDLLK